MFAIASVYAVEINYKKNCKFNYSESCECLKTRMKNRKKVEIEIFGRKVLCTILRKSQKLVGRSL